MRRIINIEKHTTPNPNLDKLTELMDLESNHGDNCDTCPAYQDCIAWWDNKVCNAALLVKLLSDKQLQLMAADFLAIEMLRDSK